MLDMPTSRTVGLGLVALGAAIAALLPVFLVIYPSAGVGQADAAHPDVILPIVARNSALVIGPGIVEAFGHAIGAAAILGFWLRSGRRSFLLAAATLAGLLWAGIDLVDNLVTLQIVPALASRFVAGDAAAGQAYLTTSALVDAIRLAGHFGGGIWVVGTSLFSMRGAIVPAILGWAGIVVGLVLAANPFVPALLNVSFMTLPLWLIVFGAAFARTRFVAERTLNPSPVPGEAGRAA
jgi:hypothetical protein